MQLTPSEINDIKLTVARQFLLTETSSWTEPALAAFAERVAAAQTKSLLGDLPRDVPPDETFRSVTTMLGEEEVKKNLTLLIGVTVAAMEEKGSLEQKVEANDKVYNLRDHLVTLITDLTR